MSGQAPSSRRGTKLVLAVIAVVAILLLAFLGTGLSVRIDAYNSTEVPLLGVSFDITVENYGLLEQTKVVRCEVRTIHGTFESAQSVTAAPGENVDLLIFVPIALLDPGDIVEKRCYIPVL